MPDHLLYGAAYYDEYLPYERLDQDFQLMAQAGMNTIRIAESTWSTWEPREGEFDFSRLHRVLDAAQRHQISVIIGTPTYAIPPWLARKYPDILSDSHSGRCRYGARQNFDLTHPGYRSHAERIIRRLMEAVQGYRCVIGFQLDNETKPYDTCSSRAQALFKAQLQAKYGTVEALNQAMGFAYWSNSLGSWEDLPDVRGTINGSYGAAYQAFQRGLVTEFLQWQRSIVDEYRRPDQFVTHNFDYQWRGFSFGLQPDVDQFQAAEALTIAGCDIYHDSEDGLTGAEIAFGGALARGLKGQSNYLVLETQAQGNFGWLPYPGQLRLQAFSHLAAGADGVSYWHWHSIHNAIESYWKGVLSHDLEPNETYREAMTIGRDFQRLSPHLLHLRKQNRVAILVSNLAQTGLQWFPTCHQQAKPERDYSDYLRWICDALYHLNVEYDLIDETQRDFSPYALVICPALYAAQGDLICELKDYVCHGGHLLATFKSFFADENLTIRHQRQPYGLTDCFGLTYDQFTQPRSVTLESDFCALSPNCAVSDWMELLQPTTAQTLAVYRHPVWGGRPAVTRNRFGQGEAAYLGCYFAPAGLEALLEALLPDWGVPLSEQRFPLIVKQGYNQLGRPVTYYLNYSAQAQHCPCSGGIELLSAVSKEPGEQLLLPPWGVAIVEGS